MVALWIWVGDHLAPGALGVRLLGPVAAFFGSLLIYRAARDFGREGVAAAAILNATLLLGAGAVTMTPDTPLIFFWSLGVFAMGRLAATGRGGWWLLAGVATGLALDSKYTAALLPLSVGAWLIGSPGARSWLRRPEPYIGGLIASSLFAPVLWWNAHHGWISFLKQGGRGADWRPARAAQYLAELLGAQIGLATPILFALMVSGALAAARRWRVDPKAALLTSLIAVPAAVFVQHAIGDRVQGNWPCVLYPAASIAAATAASRWRSGVALGLGLAVTFLVYIQAVWSPFPLSSRLDVTLARLGGWRDWAETLDGVRRSSGADFLASDEYGLAAELAFEAPGTAPVIGAEPRWRWFDLPNPAPALAGQRGLLIRKDRPAKPSDPQPWPNAAPIGLVTRSRNGKAAESYQVYVVVGPPATDAARLR